MSTITELTQKSQDQFLEAVREGQNAVVDAVGAWSQTVQGFASAVPPVPGAEQLPSAEELIDNTFDLVEKLVARQREFARNLAAAAAPAAKAPAKATAAAASK